MAIIIAVDAAARATDQLLVQRVILAPRVSPSLVHPRAPQAPISEEVSIAVTTSRAYAVASHFPLTSTYRTSSIKRSVDCSRTGARLSLQHNVILNSWVAVLSSSCVTEYIRTFRRRYDPEKGVDCSAAWLLTLWRRTFVDLTSHRVTLYYEHELFLHASYSVLRFSPLHTPRSAPEHTTSGKKSRECRL